MFCHLPIRLGDMNSCRMENNDLPEEENEDDKTCNYELFDSALLNCNLIYLSSFESAFFINKAELNLFDKLRGWFLLYLLVSVTCNS